MITKFAVVLLLLSVASDTTQVIEEAKLKLDLPGPEWFLADKKDNGRTTVYFFKRQPITDSTGLKVIPNIGVIVETIEPDTDLVLYSTKKRMVMPFEVQSMFVHDDPKSDMEFHFANALGFKGGYNDEGGRPHTIYIIHAINGDKGIQIICDVTSSLFDVVDLEFRRTIKTIEKL